MDIHALTTSDVLDRISRHCPEAMSTYLHVLHHADGDGNHFFSRREIEEDMSEEYRKFRNDVKKLSRENLIEWHPIDNGISITLIDETL